MFRLILCVALFFMLATNLYAQTDCDSGNCKSGILSFFTGAPRLPDILKLPDTEQPTDFVTRLHDEHTKLRALHNLPAQILDNVICNDARQWAARLSYSPRPPHDYSWGRKGNQENVGWSSANMSPADMANAWYTSRSGHKRNLLGDFKRVGYAAVQRRGSVYFVARYAP